MSAREIVVRLTEGEAAHLLELLEGNEEEGVYWGNLAQFKARHARLVAKLTRSHAPPEPASARAPVTEE